MESGILYSKFNGCNTVFRKNVRHMRCPNRLHKWRENIHCNQLNFITKSVVATWPISSRNRTRTVVVYNGNLHSYLKPGRCHSPSPPKIKTRRFSRCTPTCWIRQPTLRAHCTNRSSKQRNNSCRGAQNSVSSGEVPMAVLLPTRSPHDRHWDDAGARNSHLLEP